MNITFSDINATRKLATASFSGDETAEEVKRVVREFSSKASLPGFRPGKAPEHLVKNRFRKQIKDEISRSLVAKGFDDLSNQLEIYSLQNVEEVEIKPGEPAEIKFTIDVVPQFELPVYEGVEVKVPAVTISEEDVDNTLNHLRRERAEMNVVEREAAKGDYVKLRYEGKIDDQLISELVPDQPLYGTQNTTWEEAGAENAPGVPAVVNGVIGMKAGDSKTVEEEFAEDFHIEALRGKKATYQLDVSEVREMILPELNEEFLSQFGTKDEAELRQRIRESLEQSQVNSQNQAKRDQVIDYLLRSVDFPIPESGVQAETQNLLIDYMQRQIESGVSQESLQERSDELTTGAAAAAQGRIKLDLILNAIAKKESIKVESEDLQNALLNLAMQQRVRPDELVKELQQDRSRVDALRRQVLQAKVIDYLLEKANVVIEEQAEQAAS